MSDKIISMDITVDDGSVRVPVKNTFGEEIGVFCFRPTDVGIIDRYNRMVERFEEVTEPLQNVSLSDTGEISEEETAAMREAKDRLYTLLNEMFGGNMAEAFFGTMHPFSPVDGSFYCEKAIKAVGDFIAKQFEEETERMNKRVAKYTAKYRKDGK